MIESITRVKVGEENVTRAKNWPKTWVRNMIDTCGLIQWLLKR